MHWILFCCCMDMSIWAFAFSIGNIAGDYETCLLWRRIASIGWGTVFSFFLHYVLLLTGRNSILRKKWIYLLLYIPAALNVFLYGIYTKSAILSYNLINTNLGWINISGNTILDWYYNIYYISYSVIGIILLFHWGISSKEITKRKQSILIGTSFSIVVVGGTLTEYIINAVFTVKVPQIVTVVILIPMLTMFYCIRRYGFMIQKPISKESGPNQILSEYTRSKMYFYLSIAYTVGGFVNFGAQFFGSREPIAAAMLFSMIMLLLGLMIFIIQSLKISTCLKDRISNAIIFISIPIMILKYCDYSAIYAWAVPVIFIMVAIAFNQRRMLGLIGIFTFATLIWVWVKMPVSKVAFSRTDHISRIIILAIIIWFGFFINRTYIQIITENKEKVRSEKLLSNVSTILMAANESDIDEKILEIMKLCGLHFDLDRVNIFFFTARKDDVYKEFEWCAPGIEPIEASIESTGRLMTGIDVELLKKGGFCISDIGTDLKEGIGLEWLKRMDKESFIIKLLRNKDEVNGIVRFGSSKRLLKCEGDQQETINVLTHLISDIWLKVEAEKEVNYKAYYDTLTGLPNRVTFSMQLEQAINTVDKTKELVGVIFVDIDSFKTVNDTMGHESGDLLLVQAGIILRDCICQNDTIARFGGDEFVVMISQAGEPEDIQRIAERITESFRKPIIIKEQEFYMTASVGAAIYPVDGENAEELIKNADLAMYVSKENGKNRYTMCSNDMKNETYINIKLTNDLHRAIDNEELMLYYQPQVNTKTKEIVGVEALVRWQHPKNGIIMPGVFIPLAEKSGLINHIGRWVLYHACLQNKKWQDEGLKPIKIAVNLSLGQFLNSDLVGIVRGVLEETGLNPDYLELEITESIAIYDIKYITGTINNLKELGVHISIDDFGMEYSSLSRLKTLPVDKMKIDMHFISGIAVNSIDEGIIKVILQLGEIFDITVLAEGVETEKQLAFLKENGCYEIQGFYFYKPLPAVELEKILKSEWRSTTLIV